MPPNLLPADRRRSNPFATRHTRPGAVPPLDPAGAPLRVEVVLAALERHRRVAIVGPHGTGDSTDPHAGPCMHVAPIATVKLEPRSVLRYRYWLAVGDAKDLAASLDTLAKRHAADTLSLTLPPSR